VEQLQADPTDNAKQKSRRPGAIPREADLFPLDPAKAKRNPCEEEEIRRSAKFQNVMLAGHVDGDDDDKFDEDEPCVVAPSPATTIGGSDFHFGRASEGQYAEKREKVSVKTKILVQSFQGWRSLPSNYNQLPHCHGRGRGLFS